ncbi:MAG TPA: FKBP-type peptidyl-prolyl cis-trans isomerase [Blastocatellia bacterium]|nr:FKBP-type peptidyl-prolyl cis-trans isomerase [Blastocatellia bacterium]
MRNAKIFRAITLYLPIVFFAVIVYCAEVGKGPQAIQFITQQSAIAAPPDVVAPPSDARTTASGVAMKALKYGRGAERPKDNDCVKAHFTVWQRDGVMLASSRLRGTAEVQCMRTVFPGVAEALKTMVIGEERRIWVPGRLTFTSADEDDAPPKVDITMDIELLAIIKAPSTPPDLKAAPKRAVKTDSGLAFRTLEKGAGTRHPSSASQVKLHLSGWTTDGVLFESTVRGGKPAVYIVSTLIPGLHEGVLGMVVGEKRRFWIPAALAYGEKRGRRGVPTGNLVYDVQLLAIGI